MEQRPQLHAHQIHYTPLPYSALPSRVRDAFHSSDEPAQALPAAWDYGWRVGNLVFAQVANYERSVSSARIRQDLQVEGLRIARPVRAADGRFTSSGWRASQYVPGQVLARVDETVAAALRLDEAFREVDIPDSFKDIDFNDVFSVSDHLAWSRQPQTALAFDTEIAAQDTAQQLLEMLSPYFAEVNAPMQVCHADMFATTIYAGNQAPTVTDFVGVARPYGYSAALAIVDALIAEATELSIVQRYDHIPEFSQLIVRALAYRILVHGLHPESRSNIGSNLEWVVRGILSWLSAKNEAEETKFAHNA